ncbi:MAG: serine hydrolase [Acidimicrobiales bacterium]
MRAFLASRVGSITAGIYCPATGATYLYRPGVEQITASMVKIDILATLLHEDQVDHGSLSPAERDAATTMIEQSNNQSAQMLWNQIGGFGLSTNWRGTGGYYAISAFDALVGMRQSVTSWGWGTMRTTPADYLRLLRAIWLPSRLLDPASAEVERQLMEHVVPWQRFGVPSGVPATAVVGVKDGWLPDPPAGWQVNSAGYVHQGSTTYLAVLMSTDPTETYGIATLDGLGSLLWRRESRDSRR